MKKFLRRYLEFFIVFGLISLFAIFYLWDSLVITIYPGHAGVYFRRLFNKGTVIERSYGEGVHFILPWNKMYIYDVRITKLKQKVEVLSQNGLTINVVVSVRYYLLKEQVPLLHQQVGENYKDKVIIPSTISSVREVIGKYLPEQLYTTARHLIQDEILVGTIEETGRLPIIYSDMIIEVIKLPKMINTAIETKLRHQQEYLEYQFKIQKAEQEKKRIIIEASGIKKYQEIIAESLSEPLLKWQGIQATKDIAKSTNTKIIIIGGKDGLPIILNTEDNGRKPLQLDIDSNEKGSAPIPGINTESQNGKKPPQPDIDSTEKESAPIPGINTESQKDNTSKKAAEPGPENNIMLNQDSPIYGNHNSNAKQ